MSARNLLSSAGLHACALLASLALTLHAQAPAVRPTFEVAAIKRNVSGAPRSGARTLPGGRINVINLTLRQIIRGAYGSNDLDVEGGPMWIDTDRWDIVASAGTSNPDVALEPMMKALLADRFKLRAHTDTRDGPIYGLVFARPDKRLVGKGRTLTDIGQSLSPYAERRVFDRTGVEERYDYELKWSEDVSFFTAARRRDRRRFRGASDRRLI